ncbi:DUF721 domain-containing protein [Candidatus Calescamantes bacterium]|nr:DUF721 domain-containing protein [Candidatus Calescamantes bacterium]
MGKKEPERLDGILEKIIKEIEKRKEKTLNKKEVYELLEKEVLPGISRHIKFGELKRKKITIGVDNPSWLFELKFRKQEIMRTLNKFLGREKIQEVKLRLL